MLKSDIPGIMKGMEEIAFKTQDKVVFQTSYMEQFLCLRMGTVYKALQYSLFSYLIWGWKDCERLEEFIAVNTFI